MPGRFDYDYADLGLSLGDLTGLDVQGSYAINDNWLAVGRFSYLCDEQGVFDLDQTTLSVGGGYRYPLLEDLDLLGTAELEFGSIKLSAGGASASDNEAGIRLRGGARYGINDRLEVFGGLGLRTIFDGEFVLDAGALYAFDETFSAFGKLELGDDTLFTLGVRFGF